MLMSSQKKPHKKSQKKVIILNNYPTNYNLYKSSLASSLKVLSSSLNRKKDFFVTGNKFHRSISISPLQNPKNELPILKIIEEKQNIIATANPLENSKIINGNNNKQTFTELDNLEENKSESFDNAVKSKINFQSDKIDRLSKEFSQTSYQNIMNKTPLDPLLIKERELIGKETKESLENIKEMFEIPRKTFIDSINFRKSSLSHDFYELKEQYFKNYKYKRYDKQLNSLENKALAKHTLLGVHWYPSIESIIQNSSYKNEKKGNIFEKLREEYFLWKKGIIDSREKNFAPYETFEIDEKKDKNQNLAITPNTLLERKQLINVSKPKTTEGIHKRFLFDEVKGIGSAKFSLKEPSQELRDGEKLVSGFKRTFSTKYNEIIKEFNNLLIKTRKEKEVLEIVGLKKNIQKNEKNKESKKIGKFVSEIDSNRISIKIFQKRFDEILNNIDEILLKIFYKNIELQKNGIDFDGFLKFYEVFVIQPTNMDKVNKFMMDFFKIKNNSLQNFLKIFEILIKSIKNESLRKTRKEEFYEIFERLGIFDHENQIFKKQLLEKMVNEGKISFYELFENIFHL